MIKHAESHLDHALTDAQIDFIFEAFAGRTAFFKETINLPNELGTVPCGLYGPFMGDPPVTEAQLGLRGTRVYPSRLVRLPVRPSTQVSVIGGPHDGHDCILYTAFGGPITPKEPGDTAAAIVKYIGKQVNAAEPDDGLNDVWQVIVKLYEEYEASVKFWAEHALAL